MASFWGMSSLGKDMQERLKQLGISSEAQFQDLLQRSQGFGAKGDWLRDWASQYNLDAAGGGFGTPEDIRGYGQGVMPGVDEAINRRQQRLQEISNLRGGMRPGGETANLISGNLDTEGQRIGQTYDDVQGDINDTFGRNVRRESDASAGVISDLTGRYGALEKNINTGYGDLRGDNARTFAELTAGGDTAYGDAITNLEQLKPGGEAATARTARAFAPQMASTLGRLRRFGIDPNSPQAQAVIGRVEAGRGRAMDDSMADATRDYVSQKNLLTLDRYGNKRDLGLGRLGGERDLALGQLGATTNLGREQGDLFRNELRTNAGNLIGLDLNRSGASIGNTERGFQREADLYGRRSNLEQARRQMELQDFGIDSDLQRELNDEELQALGLRNQQFDRGMAFRGADLQRRDQAAQNLANQGQQQYGNMFQANNQAGQWGNAAGNIFNQQYQQEAANAGWGKKLLGGLGVAALNFIPGAGPMLSQGAGQVMGRVPGFGGGQQQQGGWGTPMQFPQSTNRTQVSNAMNRYRTPDFTNRRFF